MSTLLCGKISKTPPKRIHNERRCNCYSCCSIVAGRAVLCPGDAVFHCCKRKYFVLGSQKRTQLEISGLSYIYTTLSQNSSTQIFECVQRILQITISWTWERVAYNVNNTVKWGSLVFLTHSLEECFIFKNLASDYSNMSLSSVE